jgi:oxygen-independent coproporphyrinogen-3 oxidase
VSGSGHGEVVARATTSVRHLYVHVPFCPTICPFCDFHVLERRRGAVDAYLQRLDREAAETAERFSLQPGDLDTVYLGGGTPSHLRDDELERLVDFVRRRLGWARAEATLEVHPSTVRPGRPERWRALGFTRLSVGLQSTDDRVLRFLGRPHDAAAGLAALDAARRVDGVEVSADLITAVPGQDVERDLRAVAGRGVDHLSAYTLTIEPGTPFARDGVEVEAEAEARALRLAAVVLAEHGLERYEVSNHARPGAESDHNLGYWRNEWYLGLGPSAAAYEPVRTADPPGVRGWRRTNPTFEAWLAGAPAELEAVTGRDVVADGLLVGLRLREGVDLARLTEQAGLDVDVLAGEALARLQRRGWIERAGTIVRASPEGLTVLDQVAAELV